jgi:hypothetical protein
MANSREKNDVGQVVGGVQRIKVKLFDEENDMIPHEPPECLKGHYHIEKLAIAKAVPVMSVYRKKGGHVWLQGPLHQYSSRPRPNHIHTATIAKLHQVCCLAEEG